MSISSGPNALARFFAGTLTAMVLAAIVIAVALVLAGHVWFVAFGLGCIWSFCLVFIGLGLAYLLWPVATSRFQAKIRSEYGAPIAEMARRLDRSLGLEIESAQLPALRLRLLGAVVIVIMLAAAVAATWLLVAAIEH